jgi:putative transposase
MKRSKFSEWQIVYAIRKAESGTLIGDLCRHLGVSDATYHAWKKKYAHLGVSERRHVPVADRRGGNPSQIPSLGSDAVGNPEAMASFVRAFHAEGVQALGAFKADLYSHRDLRLAGDGRDKHHSCARLFGGSPGNDEFQINASAGQSVNLSR